MRTNLFVLYPFNLSKEIFGCEDLALRTFLPGLEIALAKLSAREKEILEQRYEQKLTYAAIAELHGLSRERIRQILAKTLRKLKHPMYRNSFSAVSLIEAKNVLMQNLELMEKYDQLSEKYDRLFEAKSADTCNVAWRK